MIKKSACDVKPGFFIEYEVMPGFVDEAFVASICEDNNCMVYITTDDGVVMQFHEQDEIWVL